MAFTDLEKRQIRDYLAQKGFRFAALPETEEEVLDFIPAKGELVFVKDKLYLAMGDGVKVTPECRRYLIFKKLAKLTNLEEKAKEIWRHFDLKMGVGSRKDVLYPPQWLNIMMATKPAHFNVKWITKDPLPANSPMKGEWDFVPLDPGFERNYDGSRKPGEDQYQAIVEHIHTAANVPIRQDKSWVDRHIWGDSTWAMNNINFERSGRDSHTAGGMITRPHGMSVLRIWKTAEALEA